MDHNIINILSDLKYFKLNELAKMREVSKEYYQALKYINFYNLKLSNLIIKYLNIIPITITTQSMYFKNKKNFNHNRRRYIKSLISSNSSFNNIKHFSSFIFTNYNASKNYDKYFNENNSKIKILLIKNDKFCCLKKYSGCEYINKRRKIENSNQLKTLLDYISFSQIHPIRKYELD